MDSGIQFVDNKGNEVSFDELIKGLLRGRDRDLVWLQIILLGIQV